MQTQNRIQNPPPMDPLLAMVMQNKLGMNPMGGSKMPTQGSNQQPNGQNPMSNQMSSHITNQMTSQMASQLGQNVNFNNLGNLQQLLMMDKSLQKQNVGPNMVNPQQQVNPGNPFLGGMKPNGQLQLDQTALLQLAMKQSQASLSVKQEDYQNDKEHK